AVAADDGIVLVDTGMHEPGSMTELERAFNQVGLSVDEVRLVVCTHAHVDHWGQAATICDRTGCEMWMHPDHEHGFAGAADPDVGLARRLEIGRQSGVSEAALARYAEQAKDGASGIARVIEPDRELVAGVCLETDLGTWRVFETPGHAPSHVCLFQAERRLLISGDHVLGRISLYFDYGWTPDPIGEFLGSLDVVDGLDARLALSGHGKPFLDVHGHIEGNRRLVRERLDATLAALAGGPRTALEITPHLHGEPVTEANAAWWLPETLCYLRHLELVGQVARESDDGVERWSAALSDSRTKP
ncbi:MAG: MBL fold metallo-hydrolase, partial [Solirubrobacterales bacterium]|nr:MBL fold metallo-hydrolase [Solirubrobacterales bacterium]